MKAYQISAFDSPAALIEGPPAPPTPPGPATLRWRFAPAA